MSEPIYGPIDLPESPGFYWAWMPSHGAFCLMCVEQLDSPGLSASAWAVGLGPVNFSSVLHMKIYNGVVWYGPNVPMPEPVHLMEQSQP